MFEELREMNKLIVAKQEKIDELRATMVSMTMPLGEKVQTTPSDRLPSLMCKVIMLEAELNAMIDEYANLKGMVTREIFSLENEEWQDILYSKYVEFQSWGEIADRKGSTVKAVMQKKKRAMKKLKSTTS